MITSIDDSVSLYIAQKNQILKDVLWDVRFDDFCTQENCEKLNTYFRSVWKDVIISIKDFYISLNGSYIGSYESMVALVGKREIQLSSPTFLTPYL